MGKKSGFFGVILFYAVILNQPAIACSTFCLRDNTNIVFGRSYDWDIGYGYMMTNLRNVKKTRFLPYAETPATWTSKYGSITFNQYGREYPIGGMNETGLVVEVMTLKVTQYPGQDERAALDELGWVQYQLDNSASVEDVIESDKKIRISNKTLAKLHFLVSDSTGNTLVVEFIDGKSTFYYNENLPQKCLTNSPYNNSLSYLIQFKNFGGDKPVDYLYHSSENSLDRFAIVADMLNKYDTEKNLSIIDYSFDILEKVKDEKRSQFQIVYNIKLKNIYFRSLQSHEIKLVTLDSFNFECTSQSMMIDINTTDSGNICDKFTPYNLKTNMELIVKAYPETGFNLPENLLSKFAEWPENTTCIQNK